MPTQEHYRLPDGTTTTNTTEYCDAWHKLAEPFEKILDADLAAFDPGLSLRYRKSRGAWKSFQIGGHDAMLLYPHLVASLAIK
jgi:hypothetical protein